MRAYYCFLLLLFSLPTEAQRDFTFPTTQILQKKTLIINGKATKEATFLDIAIYDVALYLEEKSRSVTQIVEGKDLARILIHFRLKLRGRKLATAWLDDMKGACPQKWELLEPEAIKLARKIPDIEKWQTMRYDFLPDGVEITIGNTPLGKLSTRLARNCVLKAFVGETAPSQLAKELLGAL